MDPHLLNNSFVFILPDKGQSTKEKPFSLWEQYAESFGATVFCIDINWASHSSIQACTFEATKKVQDLMTEFKPQKTYLLSSGIGALIAVQLGHIFHVNAMLLCSMPPYFEEEQAANGWRQKLKAKANCYKKCPTYPAKQSSIPTFLLKGERDKKLSKPELLSIRDAYFNMATHVLIPKAGTKLNKKTYLAEVEEQLELILKKY